MKISEVIKKLEELKSKEGDVDVVVEYRDGGGSYYDFGYDLFFEIVEDISLQMPAFDANGNQKRTKVSDLEKEGYKIPSKFSKDGYIITYELGHLDKAIVL